MRDILLKLEEAKKTWASRKMEGEQVYAIQFNEKLKELEGKDGALSKAELATYIRKNWDWSQGGPVPQKLL